MTKRRLSLLAAGLLVGCGFAQAQQASPPAAAVQKPVGQAGQKGACYVKSRDGLTTCSSGLDAGACNATGLESGVPATFQAGDTCP